MAGTDLRTEYHESYEQEFFPMFNKTFKHRVKFPAFLIAAAITTAVAVVAVINLYVKCSPIAIGFTDAILDVDIKNNIDDDPVEYMLVKKSDYPIINDDNFTLIEKIIEKGVFESDDTGLYFKGLEPGTTYSVVFRTFKDGEDRLVKVYDFTTASPGEPGPGPVIPIGPVSSTDPGMSYPESSSDSQRSSEESSSSSPSSQSIGPSSSSSTSSSSSESSSSEQPAGLSATLSVYNTEEDSYGTTEDDTGELMLTGYLMGTLTINGTKLDESGEIVEYPEQLDIDNIRLTITGSEQGTIVSNATVVGVWGTLERNSASIEIESMPFELGYPQETITVTAVITHRDGQLTATGTYTMPAHGRDLTLSVTVFDNTAGGDIDYGTDDNGEIVWYPMLGATYYLDGIKLNDAGDDFVYPSDIYTTEAGSIYATGRDGRVLADNTGVDMDIEDVVEGRITLSADYLPLNIARGLYDNETIHFELGVGTNLGYITRTTDYTFRAPYTVTHVVTFETEHGSPPRSQYVNHGEYARNPGAVDPAGADYTFDYWYDPSNAAALTAFDFANTPITDDITLRAHWTENQPDPSQLGMTFAAADDGEDPPISTLDGIDIAFPNVTGTLTISGARVNGNTLVMPDSIDSDNITVNFSDGETAFDRSMSGTLNVGSEVTITIDDLFDDGWPAGKTVTLTATVPYTYNGTTGSLTATTTYEVPSAPVQPDDLSLSLKLNNDPSHMESYFDDNDQVMYIPAITPVITLEGAVVENGAVTDPRSIANTVTFTFTRSTDSTAASTVSFDASVRIEGQDVYIDVPQFTLPYQGLFGGETVTADVTLVCDGNEIVSNIDSYTAPQETDPDDVSLSVSVFERNPGEPVEYIETGDARTYVPELNAVVVVEGATIDPTNSAITFPSALSGDTVDVLIEVKGSDGRQIDILTMTGDVSVAGGNAQITVYNLPMGDGLFNNETITVIATLMSDDFDNPGYREGSGTYLFTAPSDPTPVAPDFTVNSERTVLFYGSGDFERYNGLIDSASVNLDVDALNNDGTVNSVSAVIQRFESGSPANTAATHTLDFEQTGTGYHISGLSFTNLQLTGENDEIYVVITMNYTLDGETLNKDVRIPVELSLLV